MRFCLFVALLCTGCVGYETREVHHFHGTPQTTEPPAYRMPPPPITGDKAKPVNLAEDTEPAPRIVGPIRVTSGPPMNGPTLGDGK